MTISKVKNYVAIGKRHSENSSLKISNDNEMLHIFGCSPFMTILYPQT